MRLICIGLGFSLVQGAVGVLGYAALFALIDGRVVFERAGRERKRVRVESV